MDKRFHLVNFAGLILMVILLATVSQGCATRAEADKEREAAAAAAEEGPKQNEQIAQLENKIAELEARLTALNEKINIENGVRPTAGGKSDELPTERIQPSAAAKNATVPMPKAPAKQSKFAESFQQDESIDRYREAKILFDSHRPTDAVLEFSEFIKDHPRHPLAANAQLYIGLGYLQQKEYKLAEEELSRVLLNYPYSNAIPDALASLATVSDHLGKSSRAMYFREKLKNHFANSPQSKITASNGVSKHAPAPVTPEPETVKTIAERAMKKPATPEPATPEPPTAPVPEMSSEDAHGFEPSVVKEEE